MPGRQPAGHMLGRQRWGDGRVAATSRAEERPSAAMRASATRMSCHVKLRLAIRRCCAAGCLPGMRPAGCLPGMRPTGCLACAPCFVASIHR
eukprot:360311-Chlamydomonas_euryale.AAC.1